MNEQSRRRARPVPSRIPLVVSRSMPRAAAALICCLSIATSACAADNADAAYGAVDAANRAFAQGDYAEALAGYESAAQTLGESAELAYNRAAAHYKLEQYEPAGELLAKAALSTDPDLSRRARFNWGNCEYASTTAALAAAMAQQPPGTRGEPPPTAPQLDPGKLTQKLESAIRHYRGALEARGSTAPDDPTERAARENIERAQRLIEKLEQLKQQQEQQQNRERDNPQEQDQQEDQQEDQQSEQRNEDQQQEQEEQSQPDEQQQQRDDQEQQAQPGEQQEREMTPDEAEAVLQAVRDKEKQRRDEKLRRIRTRRVPVVKDW